jgi:hypothetical protein
MGDEICVGCKHFRFVDGEMTCLIDADPDECDTTAREEYDEQQNRRRPIFIDEEN